MDFFRPQEPMFGSSTDYFMNPWGFGRPQRTIRKPRPLVNPSDNYNPFFDSYVMRKQPSCNCLDCRMERYYRETSSNHKNGQKQSRKPVRNKEERAQDEYFEDKEVKNDKRKEVKVDDVLMTSTGSICRHSAAEMPNEDVDVENKGMSSENEVENDSKNLQDERKEQNAEIEEECNGEDKNENEEIKGQTDKDEKTIQNATTANDRSKDAKNKTNSENKLKNENDKVEHKISLIVKIREEVSELLKRVDSLSTNVKSYDYLYCEEMLVKCLLKLDEILTEGEETIRTARKNVVNEINEGLKLLEGKLD